MRQDDRGRRRALVHINKRVRVQERHAEVIERSRHGRGTRSSKLVRWRRAAGRRRCDRVFKLSAAVRAGFGKHARGQGAGRVVDELAVQETERLGRDRRDGPLGAARVRVGAVEHLEERVPQVAPDEDIKAAALAVLGVRRTPARRPPCCSAWRAPGEAREKPRARPSPGSSGPRRRAGVADGLAVQTPAILTPEQRVVGVGGPARASRSRSTGGRSRW